MKAFQFSTGLIFISLLLQLCAVAQDLDTNRHDFSGVNPELNDSSSSDAASKRVEEYRQKFPERQIYYDSLLENARADTDKKKLADLYIKMTNDPDYNLSLALSDSLLHQAMDIYSSLDMPYNVMQCYNYLSVLYFSRGDSRKALGFTSKALEIADELGLDKNIAIIYSNMTLMYIKLGDYEKANEYNFMALRIFKKLDNKLQIARCNLSIGSVYLMLKDYDKALEYIGSARDEFRAIDDTKGYSICLSNLGSIYIETGGYKKALPYFFEAVQIDEQNKDDDGISSNFASIAEVYYHLDNLSRAMSYNRQALQIDKRTGDMSGQAGLFLNLSRIFLKKKEMDSALVYCSKSLALYAKTGEAERKRQCLEQFSAIYSDLGNYKKAFFFNEQSNKLKDSLFNIDKAAKVSMLEEKYLNEKLANENLELKYTNDLQETRISNQRKLNYTYLLALFFSIIAILIIIIQLRKKNIAYKFIVKKNLDLIKKEHELKSLKEHVDTIIDPDRTKSAVPEEEKEKVLKKLEKLLENDKLFTRPDLTIDKLAKRLSTNRTYLSQIINEVFDRNYPDFINEYRVKEAMKLLSDPEKGRLYSIEALAHDAGFNNISTFNSAFKKYTGITPSVFRKQAELQSVVTHPQTYKYTNS